METLKKLKERLLVITGIVLLLTILFMIFDALTGWTITKSNVFTEQLFYMGNAFGFSSIAISLLIYALLIASALVVIATSFLYIKAKKKLPIVDGIMFALTMVILIIGLANFVPQYSDSLLNGNLTTFFIIILMISGTALFVPITYTNIRLVLYANKSEIIEEPIDEYRYIEAEEVVTEQATPVGNTVIINNYNTNGTGAPEVNIDVGAGTRTTKTQRTRLEVTTRVYRRPGAETVQDLPEDYFIRKLYESSDDVKKVYNHLKHELISYGLKSSLSRTGEVFRSSKTVYAKITITGNHIKIYYALDPKEYVNDHSPYAVSNVGGYKDIPVLFKLNSMVQFSKAQILVEEMGRKNGFIKERIVITDYYSETIRNYQA